MQVDIGGLLKRTEKLAADKDHVVVAVSGFGGAGKTTLSNKIKTEFPDSLLLQLDNFMINHGQGEGWAGGYDWQRFEQVLKYIQAGKNLHYQAYDWRADALNPNWIDQKLPKLLVVEGVRILQPKFLAYFDLTVWIDCDIETATTQGVERDRANWEDKPDQRDLEAHLATWQSVWVPKEKEFYDKFHPDKTADLIVKF